ncbi:MAG: DUF3368 domain-containing protein [bacterium]|nr:DUF3368 domain-containing protein [bacterium]
MTEPAVTDSTCLIALEQIGYLDLLPALFDPIQAPPAVEREFGAAPPWLTVVAPADVALAKALEMTIDEGEAEAIALAIEREWRIILDDLQARAVAQQMGLKLIGTVGILVRAKRAGLLAEVKPVLQALDRIGFYLSEPLMKEVLRLADE